MSEKQEDMWNFGFYCIPVFTYPLFLEISDFTGLSDYVFYDFHNNILSF